MSTSRLSRYLNEMRRAASDACGFIEGYNRADFLDDKRTQQAVVMSLFIVGEAASPISERYPEFASAHPAIRWNDMRGMRNRIAHGYFEIDLDVVWDTARAALPVLLRDLDAIPPDTA